MAITGDFVMAMGIPIAHIGQYRQRRDIREVIERVSQFVVVTARSIVSVHEIERLLDELIGPSSRPINTMAYLDWGVARAFGMVGGFRIRDETGADVTDEVRARHPAGPAQFDRRLRDAELGLNRSVLDGPSPEEEPELRQLGWKPYGAFDITRRRAEQEIEQVRRLNDDPAWRTGRIRDLVAAREILIEVNDHLAEGLRDRGVDLGGLFPSPDDARAAFDSLPSFDVAVSLKTSYHQDPCHKWTPNDIHDIDALGSTLPYCDVVVTDKAVASHIVRTGLAERLGVTILSKATDLLPIL